MLRELTRDDADMFCDFLLRNKEFFMSSGQLYDKDYATKAVQRAIDFGFNELKLHRIEANIMPENKPSIRAVK